MEGCAIKEGYFYFLKEEYFQEFPDPDLMKNKDTVNGTAHGRPCFYSFKDAKTNLFWLIPISSQIEKYEVIYRQKVKRYHRCDTIVFGEVLGHKSAFLIQNMCPTTEHYINNQYFAGKDNVAVSVEGDFKRSLEQKAKRVLALHRKGAKLIFPDVSRIEAALIKQQALNEKDSDK